MLNGVKQSRNAAEEKRCTMPEQKRKEKKKIYNLRIKKGKKKKEKNINPNNQKMAIGTYIAIITLNVNG